MPAEKVRTGARTFLQLMRKACRLSHTPGFTPGIIRILGAEEAAPILAAWITVCNLIELAMAADDYFNQQDKTSPSPEGGEDIELL